jgi:hypothetical protein
VKKLKKRFETVPLAEVLEKAVEINGSRPVAVEKLAEKKEPYAVPVKLGQDGIEPPGR